MISIVIPTRNDSCLQLVRDLARQADQINGLAWEIVVADDASTIPSVVDDNRRINALPHCRCVMRAQNVGRADIRNVLAREARGEWLLYIDGDGQVIDGQYLSRFVAACDTSRVCYGGYRMSPGPKGNLRWLYERRAEPRHRLQERLKHPYRSFNIANLLIQRELMLAHPLDERFRKYGYEDVFLGKQLQASGIAITHIDSPIGFTDDEDNAQFVAKTEEGLQTLWQFRDELKGYSTVLDMALRLNAISRLFLVSLFQFMGNRWRRNLISSSPSIRLFQLYKLGYLLNLAQDARATRD